MSDTAEEDRPGDTDRSVFTRIVEGEIPADVVRETTRVLAFRDIAPKAPVHVVVVPKTSAYQTVAELAASDAGLLAEVVHVAADVAKELTGGDYRLVFNSGERAGQTVFHVHAHVLGTPPDGPPLTEGSLSA